jgi:hypothetical protein
VPNTTNPEFLQETSTNFHKELKLAELNNDSDLDFQKIGIETHQNIPENELFQTILIGGSHLESALVKVIQGQVKIYKFTSKEFNTLPNGEELMKIVLDSLDPNVKHLNISLAYKTRHYTRNGLIDGVVVTSSKEHNLESLQGKSLGEEIEKKVLERKGRQIKVSVVNNNVSLGIAACRKESAKSDLETTITGIVSSGVNFGLFDSRISKFINLESGNFGNYKQSNSAKILDSHSQNPGRNLCEKEVGLVYLWRLFNLEAVSEDIKQRLTGPADFLELINSKETTKSSNLAQKLFQKSAALVASQIAGIIYFKDEKQISKNQVYKIILEGDLFWKNQQYRELVKKNLEVIGISSSRYKFIKINFGFLLGVALLAVTEKFFIPLKSLWQVFRQFKSVETYFLWSPNDPPLQ